MPIGAHMSIAGGVDKALERGASLGCETIQLFTRNRNRWEAKPLARPEIRRFRTQQARTEIQPLLAHASYPINLASPQQEIFDESVAAFHLNDSRKPLGIGRRVDRHEHIGRGELGKLPFYLLLHDERFGGLPMVLETPKGIEGGRNLGEINLVTLWHLRGAESFPEEPSGP